MPSPLASPAPAAMTSSNLAIKNPHLAAAAALRCRHMSPPPASRALLFPPLAHTPLRRRLDGATCFVSHDTLPVPPTPPLEEEATTATEKKQPESRRRTSATVVCSLGITSMAVTAVYHHYYHHPFPWQLETLATFALSVGAAVGMELWAQWAHRAHWHGSLWHVHESHHRAHDGAFELNDVFAVANAAPAVCLLAYGFFHRGILPELCFAAGVGITVLGISYVLVHNGLAHRRFPVGPIANVPYFRRVAAAHKIHHMGKFKGVPYGLFLGPKELEEVVGGLDELEKVLAIINRSMT